MRFLTTFAAALSLALTFATAASAESARPTQEGAPHANAAAREARKDGNHEKKFPMPGAQFKARVDQRMVKARQRLEERIASLPADKQRAARDRFNAAVATVNAEVAKAVADNVVTKEEAKKVRETARALRPAGANRHGQAGGHRR
ncbi:MAG: hypothetical protein IPF92_23465 [Myxococcales bacterium]|nr:hypothetical protein [Myxococcales bacterium]MBL0194797.1 hypothetical protein [Myxococcales bacterium]